jgi:hypothetical protein
MGNRGCLHDHQQQIVRPHQGKRWIFCRLQFKNWHREIMKPGHYTELFFLDEATALAAGHRPCAECSRPRFESFRALWALANPDLANAPRPLATNIDEVLHGERLDASHKKVFYSDKLCALPDGSFVLLENDPRPHLVFHDFLLAWSPDGYLQRTAFLPDLTVKVVTPRSIVKALAQGYGVEVHQTALQIAPPA